MARTASQDPRSLEAGETFGYPVDAGTGAFADGGALAALNRLALAGPDETERMTERWISQGEAGAKALGLPHGFALTVSEGGGDMVMFSSGWGDGFYASWVGADSTGRPVAVVTDFAVIEAVRLPTGVRAGE